MRVTIRHKAIILTKAQRATVSMMSKGYCGLSTASEMFLILLSK